MNRAVKPNLVQRLLAREQGAAFCLLGKKLTPTLMGKRKHQCVAAVGSGSGRRAARQRHGLLAAFAWGDPMGADLGSIEMAPGAYAVVRASTETTFRALQTARAPPGEAAGHAGSAAEEPVLFPGEVVIGKDGVLMSWNSVSGTYQVPQSLAWQSGLPASLERTFVNAHTPHAWIGAGGEVRCLRSGHLLIQSPAALASEGGQSAAVVGAPGAALPAQTENIVGDRADQAASCRTRQEHDPASMGVEDGLGAGTVGLTQMLSDLAEAEALEVTDENRQKRRRQAGTEPEVAQANPSRDSSAERAGAGVSQSETGHAGASSLEQWEASPVRKLRAVDHPTFPVNQRYFHLIVIQEDC